MALEQYNLTTASNNIYFRFDVQFVGISSLDTISYLMPLWGRVVRDGQAIDLLVVWDGTQFVGAKYDGSVTTGNTITLTDSTWHTFEFWVDFETPNKIALKVDGAPAYIEIGETSLFYGGAGDYVALVKPDTLIGSYNLPDNVDTYFRNICINDSFDDAYSEDTDFIDWNFIEQCNTDPFGSDWTIQYVNKIVAENSNNVYQLKTQSVNTFPTPYLDRDMSSFRGGSQQVAFSTRVKFLKDPASDLVGGVSEFYFGITTPKEVFIHFYRSDDLLNDKLQIVSGATTIDIATNIPNKSWIQCTVFLDADTDEIWVYLYSSLVYHAAGLSLTSGSDEKMTLSIDGSVSGVYKQTAKLPRIVQLDQIKFADSIEVEP